MIKDGNYKMKPLSPREIKLQCACQTPPSPMWKAKMWAVWVAFVALITGLGLLTMEPTHFKWFRLMPWASNLIGKFTK